MITSVKWILYFNVCALNRLLREASRDTGLLSGVPTCDSGDKVIDSYWIPELHVGDWLLVDNMGAYSVSMSTDFNGFERAYIYLVVTAETWRALNLSHTYNM